MVNIVCPIDKCVLTTNDDSLVCGSCGKIFYKIIVKNKKILDLRCLDVRQNVSLNFCIPAESLTDEDLVSYFSSHDNVDTINIPRQYFRNAYNTKLQKEYLYHLERIYERLGSGATILDLGCGSGGSKAFLQSIGYTNILQVDFYSDAATYLVDAHRLPFFDDSFDIILATAIFEYFYNPFVAFSEMNRVLKPNGILLGSGSFLEKMHGHSYFHYTPNGIYSLCNAANFRLEDIWVGWGFIPSIVSHTLTFGRFKRLLYSVQSVYDYCIRHIFGKDLLQLYRAKASGSFCIYATKIDHHQHLLSE